jgi:hypothetical protein
MMNMPFKPQNQKTPDIYLSGEAVDQIISNLNNSIILAKASDGSMRPFVDPMPIMQILSAAIQAAAQEAQVLSMKRDNKDAV